MESNASSKAPARWRAWRWVLVVVPALLLAAWGAGRALLGVAPAALWLPSRLTLRASLPTVVQEVRSLARLETAAGTMQQVVEGERSQPPLPAWLVGDRILFVAQGEAVAGVDLTQLRPEDVRAVGGRVQIHLPEPAIFSVRLDEPNCHVYDRTVGWLSRPDPELESRVRQRAVEKLTEAARDRGLLLTARDNAQSTVAG